MFAVSVNEYASLDSRLRELAREQGKTPKQLKNEIDAWIKNIKTPYEKGLAALYYRKYQEAEIYLDESIESSELELLYKYFYRGNAQFWSEKYSLAIGSYKAAIKIDPNYPEAHRSAYYRQGKYPLAIGSYRAALNIDPSFALAYYNLGKVYYEQNEHDLAIDSYKAAIKVKPDYAKSHNNLGNIYCEQGKHDLAIDSYKAVTRIDPSFALAYYNLACLYSVRNQRDISLKLLQKAVTLDDSFIEMAKEDSDFSNVRCIPEFQLLVR
jgi:tetratricopeptide (TPR) repeat protein